MNNQKISLNKYLDNLLSFVRKNTPDIAQKFEYHFKQNFLKMFEINYLNIKTNEEFDIKLLNKVSEMSYNDLKDIDNTFLLGFRYFYNLKFKIEKGVFVPQPDTEGLVDLVIKNHKNQKGLEVGFGTGAISIAIEVYSPNKMVAVDKNPLAHMLALENQSTHKTSVTFINEDFFDLEFETKFDFIVSNPPYIEEGDKHVSEWVKKNQPHEALYSKDHGLKFIKDLIEQGRNILKPNGKMYLEFGFMQREMLEKYLKDKVLYTFHKDINDNDRYLEISYEINKKTKK